MTLPFGMLAYGVLVSGVSLAAAADDYDPNLDLHDPKWLRRISACESVITPLGVFVYAFKDDLTPYLPLWALLATPAVLVSVIQNVRVVLQLARRHDPNEGWVVFGVGTVLGTGIFSPAWYLNTVLSFDALPFLFTKAA